MPEQEIQNTAAPEELTADQLAEALVSAEQTEPAAAPEGDTPPEATIPTVEELQATIDDLKSQKEKIAEVEANQRKMITRQANELGDLRKKAYSPITENEKRQYAERIAEDDLTVIDEIEKRAAESAKAETTYLDQMDTVNRDQVMQAVTNFDEIKDEVVALAASRGYNASEVEYFRNNPWRTDPAITIQLASEVITTQRLKTLEAENATLKNKPSEVLAKIDAAAQGSATLTPKTSPASKGDPEPAPTQIADLSDTQLAELMRKQNLV